MWGVATGSSLVAMDKRLHGTAALATAFLLAGAASPTALAAPPEPPATEADALEQIVVVATKYESRVRDIAADVEVLTGEDLAAVLSTDLADTFRYLPGIAHEGGGSRFGEEGVTIRGIGGNRVALIIDGVPVSEHFAIGNFSNATRDFLDPALVGQIEVLKGPASALYGSSAMGGVVVVRSPDPRRLVGDDGIGGDAGFVYHGRDDSSHWTARLAMAGDGLSMLAAGSVRSGHEAESAAAPADERRYDRRAGLLRLGGDNRLGHDWRVTALSQTDETASDIRSVIGQGRFRSTTRLSGDDRSDFRLLSAEYGFSGGWLDRGVLRLFQADADIAQHTRDERAAAADPALLQRDFDYEQRLRGGELDLWRDVTAGGWSHRLGVGVAWTERRTAEQRDGSSERLADGLVSSVILGEDFPLRDFPLTVTRETGAWISDQAERGPLTLLMALRFDESRLNPEPDDIWRADNPAVEAVSVSASDVSPKLGAVYHLGSDIDLYLQYAHGFRAPPFEDANIGLDIPLFNIRAIPNPDLRSETSAGWEAGLRWQTARAAMNVGVFHTDYDDFIETKARIGVDPASGRLLFQSRNIDQARIRGIEAGGRLDLDGALRGFALHASAYYAEGEDRTTGASLGSVGPPEAVLGASWCSADARRSLTALLTAVRGVSTDAQPDGAFEPPGYATLDLYFDSLLGEHLTLRAGVGNATDRVYWRWSDLRGLDAGDPALPVLAAPGRNYSIGLRWDW